jgi:hypothetical protein
MSLATLVRRMAEAGAPPEAIAIALEAIEAVQSIDAERRRKRAEQKARERREKRDPSPDGSATVARQDSDSRATHPLDKKEIPPAPPKEKNSTPALTSFGTGNCAGAPATPTPRQILLECLSAESADAVLAHRKAMRRPLTGRAAQLLAKGFLATADPNAAADMMIERGWQGFKPEWFDNERRSNGQPKQGKGSIVEAGRRLTARLVAAEREGDMQAERGLGEGDDAFRMLPGGVGKRS